MTRLRSKKRSNRRTSIARRFQFVEIDGSFAWGSVKRSVHCQLADESRWRTDPDGAQKGRQMSHHSPSRVSRTGRSEYVKLLSELKEFQCILKIEINRGKGIAQNLSTWQIMVQLVGKHKDWVRNDPRSPECEPAHSQKLRSPGAHFS
jgi:hypothetical protein